MSFSPGPRAYNLFPRLVGSMDGWTHHFARIKAMGFDWLYVNPFHFAGYSGSLYAIKDYYAFHPMFVDDNLPLSHQEQFEAMLAAAHANGLKFMMDLVVNHTAFDNALVTEHPEWFEQDEAGQVKHPGCQDGDNWVEWGDLAQVRNADSCDRAGLWGYWRALVLHYLALGVDGFRCDAAYHVPSGLWRYLIDAAKAEHPHARFFGETLGCRPWELIEVADSGFDYVFNSVRWWDYKAPWFLEAHARVVGAAPSIGFPESHDTVRLAEELDGNVLALQQRYTFAALVSTGVMMPIGFEYGFRKRLDVVTTFPSDWETPEADLSDHIARVNALKASARVFNEDGTLLPVPTGNPKLLAYAKSTLDARAKALFVINTDLEEWQEVHIASVADAIGTRRLEDVSLDNRWETIGEDLTGRIAPGACQVLLGSLAPEAATLVVSG
ncbi:MAG TPA: alpha-amylase family glycosyl hydrolase [Oscillatoriaceae cyanobacterium]